MEQSRQRRALETITLSRGQDMNNFAPRIGFAYSPLDGNRMVIRGGYGVFYDRPSAAFINTIFSNYPFLREIEITVPSGNVPITTAFSQQPTNLALSSWLPFRVTRTAGAGGTYVIRDNTGVTLDPRLNVTPPGNIAETFEFRAIDRDLKTPFVHQFNLGVQYEITKNLMFEARYVHTRGQNLLQALAFNQGFDLNDPSTPDHIFERFNQAYRCGRRAEWSTQRGFDGTRARFGQSVWIRESVSRRSPCQLRWWSAERCCWFTN